MPETPSVSLNINPKSPLHKLILEAVRDRVKASRTKFQDRNKKWIEAEERALAYLPERDVDANRRIIREGGKPQYTTIQIPYSFAVLMTSHTYWTTVFLGRNPIFQFAGRHGETEQQVQAIEALVDYQVQVGEAIVPFYIWLYDVGKYGVGILGLHWEERFSVVSSIEEVEEQLLGVIPTGKTRKKKVSRRIPGYQGNSLYNVRPLDFFSDPRVPLHNFQKGEFVAVYNEISFNRLLEGQAQGQYINLDAMKLRSGAHHTGGIQQVAGSEQLTLPDPDSFGSAHVEGKKAADIIKIYECYIEIVPDNWGLGRGKLPEKWVFTVDENFQVVLGAQPLGAYHNKFPFALIELEPEGYALANRGLPEIVEPIQNTIDWLINSHFYNVRKTLNNQLIVDPSRVVMKDVLDPLPGGVWRLKPAAYGQDPSTVYAQLEINDVTRTHMADLQSLIALGERVHGVNDQVMGLLNPKGRRSATEARQTASFSINRLKTASEFFSAMGWAPLASMMVQNSQQYYDIEKKFKIVGDLAESAGMGFMDVNPETIQGFYDFVPVDGTLPVDRFAQANLWRELFAQLRNFPQIMQQYDLGKIFAWVAQISGLKNINQFKISPQVMGDEQIQDQAQRGNLVPMPQRQDMGRNAEPGQVPGMGSTG